MSRQFKTMFVVFCILLVLGIAFSTSGSYGLACIGYCAIMTDGILAIVLIVVFVQTKGLAHLPEHTTYATVSSKNIRSEWVSSGESGGYTNYNYTVAFVTDNNNLWAFNLPLNLYNVLLPGDYGTLVYKVTKNGRVHYISYTRCYR